MLEGHGFDKLGWRLPLTERLKMLWPLEIVVQKNHPVWLIISLGHLHWDNQRGFWTSYFWRAGIKPTAWRWRKPTINIYFNRRFD